MLKWCWLVVGAALSCSSPGRQFSKADNEGGAAGQSPDSQPGGRTNGGASGSATTGDGGAAGDGGTAGMADGDGGAAGDGDAAAGGDAGMAGDSAAGHPGEDQTCAGCLIGAVCVAANARNPANSCEICQTSRSRTGYSPNLGALCGSGATECSGQDTCDATGTCQENDLTAVPCSHGTCEAGICHTIPNPFDCIAPSPPTTDFAADVYELTGTPPTAKGGVIADGRYTAKRIDLYNWSGLGVDLRTFEFEKGWVQVGMRYYGLPQPVAYIPEVQFSGSYTDATSVLNLELERCDPQYNIDVPDLPYTATANGIVTIEPAADGATIVTSFVRQ